MRALALHARRLAGTPALSGLLEELSGLGRYERRTALHMAMAARDLPYIERVLAGPDLELRRAALRAVRTLPVADDAAAAVLDDAPANLRRAFYRMLRRGDRPAARPTGSCRTSAPAGATARPPRCCPPAPARRSPGGCPASTTPSPPGGPSPGATPARSWIWRTNTGTGGAGCGAATRASPPWPGATRRGCWNCSNATTSATPSGAGCRRPSDGGCSRSTPSGPRGRRRGRAAARCSRATSTCGSCRCGN
ncbi:hypothetical protein [Actinomadura sp. CNU-125]|uniref:hypothetical protein n=1 Tax=Actinomadura sp. CNU-125 TaxID=1904961 RepID=UPI001178B2A1|nr:hypothetical protein [Actinomadura sp. CNU-125]